MPYRCEVRGCVIGVMAMMLGVIYPKPKCTVFALVEFQVTVLSEY